MQNSRYKVSIILLLLFPGLANSGGNRTHFLYHGPSVAAYGRGEAGTAAPGDQASAHYNPSLLAGALRDAAAGMTLSHFALFNGSTYNYLGILLALPEEICLGISAIRLASGDVEIRRTINDDPRIARTSNSAYQLSAARRFSALSDINLGMAVKYIVEDLHAATGSAIGIDAGAFREFSGPRLFGGSSRIDVGLSAINLLPPRLTLRTHEEALEPSYRLGASFESPVAYHLRSHDTLAVFFDMVSCDSLIEYFSGIQYGFYGRYFLRSGYYRDHLTAGLGARLNDLAIDYAIDFNPLSPVNRFGLSYYWHPKSSGSSNDKKSVKKGKSKGTWSLMREARTSLREARQQKARQDRHVRPLLKAAQKNYRRKQYLTAGDEFREIMLGYPEYTIAKLYYDKITAEMSEIAQKDDGSDLERISYAKGYQQYRNHDLASALNEWEKVLQINPERTEIVAYSRNARNHLNDMQRLAREKELSGKVEHAFNEAKGAYENRQWITAIKKMENVQSLCKNNFFPAAFEWHNKAQEHIDKAVEELSRTVAKPAARRPAMQDEQQHQPDTDAAGADKKYSEGLILYAQGKITDAMRLWEIALRLNPGHGKARKALAKAKEELE